MSTASENRKGKKIAITHIMMLVLKEIAAHIFSWKLYKANIQSQSQAV